MPTKTCEAEREDERRSQLGRKLQSRKTDPEQSEGGVESRTKTQNNEDDDQMRASLVAV